MPRAIMHYNPAVHT